MEDITITNAQYVLDMEGNNYSVNCTFDGTFLCVPMDSGNIH